MLLVNHWDFQVQICQLKYIDKSVLKHGVYFKQKAYENGDPPYDINFAVYGWNEHM